MTTTSPKRVVIWCRVSSLEQGAANKESIPDQLARQRQLAYKNGWVVIDEIITDFSMDYWTYQEFSVAAAAAGWTDQLRMWAHWESKDFDVLTCRYLDRVGREQSILSEFIGRTMTAGAVIVPLDEASVDAVNYRMTGAIAGLGAAAHIDKMKYGRNIGMIGRAGLGEKISNRIPLFYLESDNRKLIPNRAVYQRLFDDIAELFLAGTSYEQFPHLLEERGHIHPKTSKRFDKTVIKRLMYSARTWGHGEFNRTGRKRAMFTLRSETWVTGRGQPPPDVFFKRDVCEPLWSDQELEDMKDELERRFYAIRGGARPNDTYAFSQLCVCEVCNCHMIVQVLHNHGNEYRYVKCPDGRKHLNCTNNLAVTFDKVQDFLTVHIENLFAHPESVGVESTHTKRSRIPTIEKDIERATKRIDNWQESLGDTHISARAELQAKINAETQRRDVLRTERARLELASREEAHTAESRLHALDSIRESGLSAFWQLPTTTINQSLRKLLGNRRVACNDGEVTGWSDSG